jgi:hypothetical protein
VVTYRDEPEDPKESHDKTSLIIPLVTKQDSDQPMVSPGTCHGDTTRYQVLTAVLLLLERDFVTIGKWLQTSVSIYRDSVCLL